jgi:hypothetical protein
MYAWEGFKKICCVGGGASMSQLIAKMEIIVDANQDQEKKLLNQE